MPAQALHRVILGYAPANVVPAVVTLVATVIYTRLLTTSAYGNYTFAFNAVMVLQAVVFFAPTFVVTRFYAAAEKDAALPVFRKTMHVLMLCLGIAAAIAGVTTIALCRALDVPLAASALLVLPLLLLRASMATGQAFNRVAGRRRRFVLLECLNALLGLGGGVALAAVGVAGDLAVMGGLVLGTLTCCALDWRQMLALATPAPVDRALLGRIATYAWPLAAAYAIGCCLQYADRFVVGSMASVGALGVYAVALSLVDRPINLICMSITAGTLPLAVERYVHEGPEAGRRQAGRNGAAMIGLILPAAVGLALSSHSIAAVLVGGGFRDSVAALIPVMAATSLLRGVSAHYIDHNFHLTKSSRTMLMVYAPSAAANLLLSLSLVPRFGVAGAAYGALACQGAAVAAGWWAARRALPLWLPAREMLKILAATATMAAVLASVAVPAGAAGLLTLIGLGVATYGAAALAVNLGDSRALLRQLLPRPSLAAAAGR